MKVVLYLRVSLSQDSNLKSQTTENQRRVLTEFCKQKGFEIVDVFEDYWTGTKENRRAFKDMMSRVGNKSYCQGIVIFSLDRLSREGISKTLSYINFLRERDLKLISYTENWLDISRDNLMADLLISVLGWVSHYEALKQRERVAAGQARARSEGKHIGRPKGSKDKVQRKNTGYLRRERLKREQRALFGKKK